MERIHSTENPRVDSLELNRETVQDLTEDEATRAAGGRMPAIPTDLWTEVRCVSQGCASAGLPCP
jgi:hypothetical protein